MLPACDLDHVGRRGFEHGESQFFSARQHHRIPAGGGSLFNVWRIRPAGSTLTEAITPRPNYVNEYPVNGIN